jgi:hypothetical protein
LDKIVLIDILCFYMCVGSERDVYFCLDGDFE